MKRLKRFGWILGYLGGGAALALFVRHIDLATLRAFSAVFWFRSIAALVAFQLLIIGLHSLQWGLLLRDAGIPVRFPRLYGARLAGAAVSILSPSLSVGGEIVRAALVRESSVSTSRLTATVAIDKYVELATRMPFVMAGLWVLVRRLPGLNPLFIEAGFAFALVVATASILLARLQHHTGGPRRRRTDTRFFARALDRVRPGATNRLRSRLVRLAGDLATVRSRALLPVFAFGLLAAGVELLQIFFALSQLGIYCAAGAAAVQSASILGGVVGILPANIGGMEATNLLSITLLGGSAATALAYSLLLRGGQVGIVIGGFAYLAVRRLRKNEARAPKRLCCSNE